LELSFVITTISPEAAVQVPHLSLFPRACEKL
jgi:hypothetical protein